MTGDLVLAQLAAMLWPAGALAVGGAWVVMLAVALRPSRGGRRS